MHLTLALIYFASLVHYCYSEIINETYSEDIENTTVGVKKFIGKTDPYTPAERNALEKFRPMVSDLMNQDYEKTDAHLIRWLRAKDLNVNKAVETFQEVQKWRKVNRIDGILNETILEFNPSPYQVEGFDRDGCPIVLFTLAALDARKLVVQGFREKLTRYVYQIVEKGMAKQREASRIFGKEITQTVVIGDFQGFNIRQHFCVSCIPIGLDLLRPFMEYYPGVLKYMILINVPRIAMPLYNILRPSLPPQIAKTFHIFPPDRKQWQPYLNQIIAPDQLPFKFGGTKRN